MWNQGGTNIYTVMGGTHRVAKVVVTDIQFQGSYYKILCKVNDLTLTALHYVDAQNTFKINLGDSLELSWDKIDITNIND